jgi:hypothetical protein
VNPCPKPINRPEIGLLLLAVGLVGLPLAGTSYRCQISGAVLPVPCPQDERSNADEASPCCPGDREPSEAPAPRECCESFRPEPSLAATPPTIDGPAAPAVPSAFRPPPGEPSPAGFPSPPESPRPPGDPPLFLLHARFLC